jgi:hypothetical protein
MQSPWRREWNTGDVEEDDVGKGCNGARARRELDNA